MVAEQVGVHVATYYRWEQGKSNPAREHRRALARVLRTTQTYLCQGDEPHGLDEMRQSAGLGARQPDPGIPPGGCDGSPP
jgi:transcriptional regulator with XRE-family HTH domain